MTDGTTKTESGADLVRRLMAEQVEYRRRKAANNGSGAGRRLAERLGLEIIGTEGHDLKLPCPFCSSSDAGRLDEGTGRFHCYACKEGGGALKLAEAVLRDRDTAKQVLVDVGIFEARNGHASTNGQAVDGEPDPMEIIAKQKGVTAAVLKVYGAKAISSRAIRIPMYDETGAVCSTITLNVGGGKGCYAKGKRVGMFLPHNADGTVRLPKAGETWYLVEGVKDAAALWARGYLAAGLPGSHMAAKFARLFAGINTIIVPDRDRAGERGADRTANGLRGLAATVRIATLPVPFKDSHGADVRDVLRLPDGERLLRQSLDDATAGDLKLDAKEIDPGPEAETFLASGVVDGLPQWRFWRGEWRYWSHGAYREIAPTEFRGHVVRHLAHRFRRLTTTAVNNVLEHVRSQAMLPGQTEPHTWLDAPPDGWNSADMLVTRKELVNLRRLVEEQDCTLPPTPRFFATCALDYDFQTDAPKPANWLKFLAELWPSDAESIATLQEWFGYCLTSETKLQKILMVIGPKRGGKGTIGRTLTAVLGKENVTGPSLSSLASHFGLWGLLGRSLAIVSDARLSGRVDQGAVVEKLLMISGEDTLTVDRKCLEPITCRLPIKIVLMSNELPKLGDSSGAMAGRLIMLRLTESWYGREDHDLESRILAEQPGILLWAIQGWQRLWARGRFVQPASGQALRDQMEDFGSPVGQFVRECCVVEPGAQAVVSDVYNAWCDWCKEHGRKEPGTQQVFGRDLSAVVPTLGRSQPRDGERRYRVYEGIGLVSGTQWNA
ncbi:MAG: phage/plasmid primase, P4 family [Pirellulales bacterium]